MTRPGPKPQPIKHGERSGYMTHLRRGEEACDACLSASAAYFADYRSTPQGKARLHVAALAKSRALQRLKLHHPAEFRALYAEERDNLNGASS